MPGNIAVAAPSGVLPQTLSTLFVESREYVLLTSQYHDGSQQRSQLAQSSRRTFRLAKRLTRANLTAFKSFWDAHVGGVPFFYYNPFDVVSGNRIGSNWDANGNSVVGRVTVKFVGNWSQSTVPLRTVMSDLLLVEVA